MPNPKTCTNVEPYNPHAAIDAFDAFASQGDPNTLEPLIHNLHLARLHSGIPRTRFTKHYAAAALAALGADDTFITRYAPTIGGAVRGYFD